MDPNCSGQDVLRCHLCETPVPSMYCDICHLQLCKACVGEHISDDFKNHIIVPFKKRGSTPKCQKHSRKVCDLYCKQCNIPICALCISSGEHEQHKKVDLLKRVESKQADLRSNLLKLEESILPKYIEIASNISKQKKCLKQNFLKVENEIDKKGKEWHGEIDTVIKMLKSNNAEKNTEQMSALHKNESEIERRISEIKQIIQDQRRILDSSDVCLISSYKSRNAEFKKFPPCLTVSFTTFISQQIDKEQICQQFGFLTDTSIAEDHDDKSISKRAFIDTPRITLDFTTEYGDPNRLWNVSCINDDKIWTSGYDRIMRLYNLKGELLKAIQTRSGSYPLGIAVARCGDLLYADYLDGSLNRVNDTDTQKVIALQGWKASGVCTTSLDDLLVVLANADGKLIKVVRYSGSKEKQSIQFHESGKPLYSPICAFKFKGISENKNLDICVADSDAGALVVVDQAGKLRFRYTGFQLFRPYGITTDSQCRIITSDFNNLNIHILEEDGSFLRFIDYSVNGNLWGLCVDTKDNLFVAEIGTGKIKKIQYYV